MMRAGVFVVVLAVGAGTALGDPEPEAEPEAKPEATTPQPRPDLQKVEPREGAINLFPESIFGQTRKDPEERPRLTLGDDRSWKVQAVQVGAMAAVFGALVGLCGGGKCMLPGGAGDFLPGWMTSEEPSSYSSPRRQQPLREAR